MSQSIEESLNNLIAQFEKANIQGEEPLKPDTRCSIETLIALLQNPKFNQPGLTPDLRKQIIADSQKLLGNG